MEVHHNLDRNLVGVDTLPVVVVDNPLVAGDTHPAVEVHTHLAEVGILVAVEDNHPVEEEFPAAEAENRLVEEEFPAEIVEADFVRVVAAVEPVVVAVASEGGIVDHPIAWAPGTLVYIWDI